VYGATATAAGKKVKVWDYLDALRTCIQLPDTASALTFSATGTTLLIASDTPSVSIWSPTGLEGRHLYTLRVACPHLPAPALPPKYTALAASDDGNHIAAGTTQGTVTLWNTNQPPSAPGHTTPHHLCQIASLEFTSTGALISRSTANALYIQRAPDSTGPHPIVLVQQTANGHMDTHRQKYTTVLRRGILCIHHKGPFLYVVMPSHPIAFLKAPANITTIACRDTRIIVGGADGSITHAFAPFLTAPQATTRPSHPVTIDLQDLVKAGKTDAANFIIQIPLDTPIRDIKDIVASRAILSRGDIHLSCRQHSNSLTFSRLAPDSDPLYLFRFAKTPTLRATVDPLPEEHPRNPSPPPQSKTVHIFPPLDLHHDFRNKSYDWTFSVEVSPTSTCAELYQLVAERIQIPYNAFYLRARGKQMSPIPRPGDEDLYTILSTGDTIHVFLRLLAGNENHTPTDQSGTTSGQIFVKTSTGKTLTLPFDPTTTTADIKRMIDAKQGTPAIQQRLIFAGKQMEDPHTLPHYAITDMDTIYQLLRLRGGMDPFKMFQQRALKQEALRQAAAAAQEATADPSGFAKTDADHQDIQQKFQAKQLAETERALAKAHEQAIVNRQLEALSIEEARATACPLASTPAQEQAALAAMVTIYKHATKRNLSSRSTERLLLHMRAKIQEGASIRNTSAAPLDRAARVQFLLAEPHNTTESYAQKLTTDHIRTACATLTSALSIVEVSDTLKRPLPQLFKITCDGTLASMVPRIADGHVEVCTSEERYLLHLEQQFDPALQLVIRVKSETSHDWALVLACLIGMKASPTQVQDAILAMVRASHPTASGAPPPIAIRMEQSKRQGEIWHRAAVSDLLPNKDKRPPFAPKLTAIYANFEDALAALDTSLQITVENTFEGKAAASSEKDKSLIIRLHLSANNYQPRQAEGMDGAVDALKTQILTQQDRLQAIQEHLSIILRDLRMAQLTRPQAITDLLQQTTDIRSISPAYTPLANAVAAELHHLEQDAALDLPDWFNTSRSLQNLALLRTSPYALATIGPMLAALTHYNMTTFPKHPTKKLEKILELFLKATAKEGLYLAAVVWIKEPRSAHPRQLLVAMDESTASRLRLDTPSWALAAAQATLTTTQNAPPQLTLLKKKLQATAMSSQQPTATGPLAAYPPEVQASAVTIYNLMMQGELIWVHTTNADGSPIQINNNHTLRNALRTSPGHLYIGNMVPGQEPVQALAALTEATDKASGKTHKVTNVAISDNIRVFGFQQVLAILTADHSRPIPAAFGQDNSQAFVSQFLGQSTAHLVIPRVNDHYARAALTLADTGGIWFSSPAMAHAQGPPSKHQPLQDHEAYDNWKSNPGQALPTFKSPLSGHFGESSRHPVDTSLEDNTFDLSLLHQLIHEGSLHVTHKDGHSLVTPGHSDLLPAIERTPQRAGDRIQWHLLEVTAPEADAAATLLFTTLRTQDMPIHIRTVPLEEIDEFLMSKQVGPDSLSGYTNSNILKKGEWGKVPLEGLIRNAARERTSTAYHTKLPDGTGHLLLLTSPTWTDTPVKMEIMYGQDWAQVAKRAATDRGQAGDILRQAKLQSAQQVLLEEARSAPIYIQGAAVVDATITWTSPPSPADPRSDPTALSHGNRTQHPYNASSNGAASAAALATLEHLCRSQLLMATPHLQGLLFSTYIGESKMSDGEEDESSDEMSDGKKGKTPTKGKVGTAAKPSL